MRPSSKLPSSGAGLHPSLDLLDDGGLTSAQKAKGTKLSCALGGKLSSEPAALQRYRTTHGSPSLHEVVAQLTQAAREQRLQPEQVEGALLALEAGLQDETAAGTNQG
ncbi:hypothetical protein HaLaN_20716, partial [Haematococcus lacustris]